MHTVINRIQLERPLEDEVFAAAQRELPERLTAIDGVSGFHLVRCGDEMLVLVIFAHSAEALDRLRDEVGNEWMRANVIPHAAGPPERLAGEVVASYQRA